MSRRRLKLTLKESHGIWNSRRESAGIHKECNGTIQWSKQKVRISLWDSKRLPMVSEPPGLTSHATNHDGAARYQAPMTPATSHWGEAIASRIAARSGGNGAWSHSAALPNYVPLWNSTFWLGDCFHVQLQLKEVTIHVVKDESTKKKCSW